MKRVLKKTHWTVDSFMPWGLFIEGPEAPEKPQQNLKPYYHRAVLFIYA